MRSMKRQLLTHLPAALNMEVSFDVMAKLEQMDEWSSIFAVQGCYDIQRIRNGYAKMLKGEISLEYFLCWREIYAKSILDTYPRVRREDLAYEAIATILRDNDEDSCAAYREELAQIELHNEVIEGKREADYFVADDEERFYIDLNEENGKDDEESLVDFLAINHRKKKYYAVYGVSWLYTDGEDGLGNPIVSCPVSRKTFEILLQGVIDAGYQEEP